MLSSQWQWGQGLDIGAGDYIGTITGIHFSHSLLSTRENTFCVRDLVRAELFLSFRWSMLYHPEQAAKLCVQMLLQVLAGESLRYSQVIA